MKAQTRSVLKSLLVAAFLLLLTWVGVPAAAHAEEIVEDEAFVEDIESFEAPDEPEFETKTFGIKLFQEGEAPKRSDRREAEVKAQSNEAFDAVVASAIESAAESIDIAELGMTPEEATQAFQDFVNANQKYFYVSAGLSIDICEFPDGEEIAQVIHPSYMYAPEEIPARREQYEAAMAEVLSWVPAGADDATKAKAVHDWLVRNCAYSSAALEMGYESYVESYGTGPWNAYGALVDKVAVCQGYSLAYADALTRLGVPCQYVVQDSAEHSWNRVCVSGHWYHVDVSWDDPLSENNTDAGFDAPVSTTYFLKSDSWMQADAQVDAYHTHEAWYPEGTASDDTSYDNKTDWETYKGPNQQTNIEKAKIELSKDEVTYDGQAQKPDVGVVLDGAKLVPSNDYTIEYGDNTNAGTATVKVVGQGNYKGETSATFTIKKASSSIELAKQSVSYTGKAVEYSGKVSKKGSSGKVSYEYFSDADCKKKATPKDMGTYYVRAKLAADKNFEAATSKPVTLIITR